MVPNGMQRSRIIDSTSNRSLPCGKFSKYTPVFWNVLRFFLRRSRLGFSAAAGLGLPHLKHAVLSGKLLALQSGHFQSPRPGLGFPHLKQRVLEAKLCAWQRRPLHFQSPGRAATCCMSSLSKNKFFARHNNDFGDHGPDLSGFYGAR